MIVKEVKGELEDDVLLLRRIDDSVDQRSCLELEKYFSGTLRTSNHKAGTLIRLNLHAYTYRSMAYFAPICRSRGTFLLFCLNLGPIFETRYHSEEKLHNNYVEDILNFRRPEWRCENRRVERVTQSKAIYASSTYTIIP